MSNNKNFIGLSLIIIVIIITFLSINQDPIIAQVYNNLIPFNYNGNIWVIDPDNLILTQITSDAHNDLFYINPSISASGRYLAYEKRVAPFEYYMGATTYNIYDLQSNSLIYHSVFSVEYNYTDLYGEPKTEAHTLLGWLQNTDTLLFVEEINNCNQDANQTRIAQFFTLQAPFNTPMLTSSHTSTAPAVEALGLISSNQNWIDYRDNCCGCGPNLAHLNYVNPSGQYLSFDGKSMLTTAIVPSPDNSKITYASSSGYDMYYIDTLTQLGTSSLIVANLDFSSPTTLHTLTNYHIEDRTVDWSPSGQHIAFITFNINQDLNDFDQYAAVVSATGNNPIILNTNSVYRTLWSPDGTKLLRLEKSGGIIIYDVNKQIAHSFQNYGNPVTINSSNSCANIAPTRLMQSSHAKVAENPPLANNLRAQPDKDSQLLGQIPPGDTFTIFDGPLCSEGYRYWYVQVDNTGQYGWTAEAHFNEYYVEPIP